MYLLLLITLMFTHILTSAQSIQMQYNKVSANEVQFTTVYKGPSAEIILPARSRITALSEQNDLNAGGGRIRVGIRVGNHQEDSYEEHTVRFTYSLIIPNQGGFGLVVKDWFPTLKDNEEVSYTLTSVNDTNMFVYPYESAEQKKFTFVSEHKPQLAMLSHTLMQSTTDIPITIFAGTQFKSSFEDIMTVYQYITKYFGKQEINEIVIVNSPFVSEEATLFNGQLILSIPGIGTKNQIRDIMVNAWSQSKENLSLRLFNMFKDTVFRIAKIDDEKPAQTVVATEETTNTENSQKSVSVVLESDPAKLVLVPQISYYEELFSKGFATNSIVEVNAEGIFNNYALLHLAHYNLNPADVLTGIETFFNATNEETTALTENQTSIPTEIDQLPPTEETIVAQEDSSTESSEKTKEITKKDTEFVDWNVITQNKLQEPLYSLYTKEVLVEKGLTPNLTAKGTQVFRNSYNIPDFVLTASSGDQIDVTWNDFKTISIDVPNNDYFTLDPEKQVPQQVFLDDYHSFNQDTLTKRRQVIALAERFKAPGEIRHQKHLDVISFVPTTMDENNEFNVSYDDEIFVVISHILSNAKGRLQPAIKEAFIAVTPDGKMNHITTRLRI